MSYSDLIRAFYAARNSHDWDTVQGFLSDDIAWHEPGSEDYSGDHQGRGEVMRLLQRLVEVTSGTFTLRPVGFIETAEHVATDARWHASRGTVEVAGGELAVFRIAEGKIAEAWFHPDGYDPQALSTVFSFQGHR
ncbi:nuclear transport factor 2 family protein [Actinomadura fulvescens]|uniref:Nuclear transport factor 2 family protein n=1 Tax=Actinomadura fulvescens TaxID=46160 RepID=A0ABP6CRY9_9ACTN